MFHVGGPGPALHDITPGVTGLPAPGLTCTSADVMTVPGAVTPGAFPCAARLGAAAAIGVPDANSAAAIDFGLDLAGAFTDELDGISVGEGIHPFSFDFDFSVDRAPANGGVTVGGPTCFGGPDVTTEVAAGGGPEAQGDIFNTGSLPLSPFGCNAQVFDEAFLGLFAPNPAAPGIPPLDDVDALTEEIVGLGPCTLAGGITPITTCPAMTIAPTSFILGFIPPGFGSGLAPDAASILVPPATPAIPPEIPAGGCAGYSGGPPCIAVHSSVLGLSPLDDIDALCWFDINGNGLPDPPYWAAPLPPPGDMYAFSLTPASPAPFSPADILIPSPFGPPVVLAPASALGLLPTDDVDALMCHSDDIDLDAFPDMVDNCPSSFNPSQADFDSDGIGNACDTEGGVVGGNGNGVGGVDDCTDGVDNDGDGLTDAADSPACDKDFDGIVDPFDTEGPSPNTDGLLGADDCADAVDNDNDGLTDAADGFDCDVDLDGIPDPSDTEGPPGNVNGFPAGADDCLDGLDNNANGLADALDPACIVPPPPVIYSVADLGTLGGPVATHDITPIAGPGPTSCTSADLLTPPGTGPVGPCVARFLPALLGPVPDALTFGPIDLGLDTPIPFFDDLNALSVGELVNTGPVDYDFSVDAAPANFGSTVGLPACGAPPNVGTESLAAEAQGDIFNTGSAAPAGCNLQVSDESILGLIAPTAGAPLFAAPLDELDALADISPGLPLAPGTCTVVAGAFLTTCPAFSLTPTIIGGTLTLPIPGDAFSGLVVSDEGSILVPPGAPPSVTELPCGGPFPCAFVASVTLGLVPGAGGDNIDALCWFDANPNGVPDQPNAFIPGLGDYYIFSLTPLSPSVTAGFYSAADLLTPDPLLPGGPPIILRTAGSLGLLPGDNVDALICRDDDTDGGGAPDLLDNCPATINAMQLDSDGDAKGDACDPCPTIATFGIWLVPPGDSDCDGFTDAAEVSIGTDPTDPCANIAGPNNEADDRWPPDFDDNTVINTTDVFQVLSPFFGTAVPPTSPRRDLFPDGVINTSDVFNVLPPFLGSVCT